MNEVESSKLGKIDGNNVEMLKEQLSWQKKYLEDAQKATEKDNLLDELRRIIKNDIRQIIKEENDISSKAFASTPNDLLLESDEYSNRRYRNLSLEVNRLTVENLELRIELETLKQEKKK